LINTAKHKDKQYKLYDGDGLCLLVTPSGGKLWRYYYRFGQTQKTLALGTYPATNLEDARRGRDAAKELLSQGFDPSEIRKQEKARNKAEQMEGQRLPYVRIGFDDRIEIWKGGNTMRLTWDEARFVASLLNKITAR